MTTEAAESGVSLLGGVAEEVIHHSSPPVLVVRPPQVSWSAAETPSEGAGSEAAVGHCLKTGGTMARKSRSELRALEARHRRPASGATVQTLSLFSGKLSEVPPPPPSRGQHPYSLPIELALHIYWSAGVEAHALGALALQTVYPDQRRALLQLQQLEERRKAVAARLLENVWLITLSRPSDGAADPGNGQAA